VGHRHDGSRIVVSVDAFESGSTAQCLSTDLAWVAWLNISTTPKTTAITVSNSQLVRHKPATVVSIALKHYRKSLANTPNVNNAKNWRVATPMCLCSSRQIHTVEVTLYRPDGPLQYYSEGDQPVRGGCKRQVVHVAVRSIQNNCGHMANSKKHKCR